MINNHTTVFNADDDKRLEKTDNITKLVIEYSA